MKAADTLIVWTEPQTGIDMALSFQEADGCATIWFVILFGRVGFGVSSECAQQVERWIMLTDL